MIGSEMEKPRLSSLLDQALEDSFGNAFRTSPHRIVDDEDFIPRPSLAPIHVGLNDSAGILSPDKTMAGPDHIDGNPHLHHFVHLFQNQWRQRPEDIRIIFCCMFHYPTSHLILK